MAELTRISWWQWIPIFRWRIVAVVESADDVPRRLPRNGVVLVGQRSRPKWFAFDCPCRRGHRILLNADATRVPRWSGTLRGPLSIKPSVDYLGAAHRCHYFVRNGRIRWVHEGHRS
jgi:hypothetical protein